MRWESRSTISRVSGWKGCVCRDGRLSPVRLQQLPRTGDSRASLRCRVSRPPRSLAVLAAGTGVGAAMERGRPVSSPRSAEPAPSTAAAACDSSPGRTGAGQTGSGGVAPRSGGGRPAAANAARERSRVQTLRHAFLELQRTLPSVPPDTKLSKLDVLLLATTYIAHLTRSLQDDNEASGDPRLGALRGDGYLHPVKVGNTRVGTPRATLSRREQIPRSWHSSPSGRNTWGQGPQCKSMVLNSL